jgi:hypothetical protein
MKKEIELDELDRKCIEELPFLIDILASTGNKIIRLFRHYYEDLRELIESGLPANWQIDNKSTYKIHSYPLTDQEDNKITIDILDANFKIESAIYINQKIDKKENNYFWIYFGYVANNTDDEIINHFYFSVIKQDLKTNGGPIQKLEFYENLKKNLIEFEIKVNHPNLDNEDTEFFEIQVAQGGITEINNAFKIFNNEVVKPFISNLS